MRPLALTLAFVAGAIALDRAVGAALAWVHHGLDGHVANGDVKTEAVADDPPFDLVLFGDSRIRGGVDPDAVGARFGGTVYNAAFDGRGVHFARGLQALRLGRGHIDGCYALSVEVIDLYEPRLLRMTPLLPYIDESPAILALVEDADPWAQVKALSSAWRFNSLGPELVRRAMFPDRDRSVNGYRPNTVVWDLHYLPPHSPLGSYTDGVAVPAAIDPVGERVLLAFTREARAAGVPVVWFTTPMHRNEQLPLADGELEPVRLVARSWLEQAAAREGVPYLSIDEERFPELRPAALYTDQMHVNIDGSKVLSELLGARLRDACGARR